MEARGWHDVRRGPHEPGAQAGPRNKLLFQNSCDCGVAEKNPSANVGDSRDTTCPFPGSGRSSGVGNGNPLQYFFPGKVYGQRSLVG